MKERKADTLNSELRLEETSFQVVKVEESHIDMPSKVCFYHGNSSTVLAFPLYMIHMWVSFQ